MSDWDKWRCKECRAEFYSHEMLRADSPFDPSETLYACPHCKTVERPDELCQEPGCHLHATCGTPFGQAGYKRHCHLHPPIPRVQPAATEPAEQAGRGPLGCDGLMDAGDRPERKPHV